MGPRERWVGRRVHRQDNEGNRRRHDRVGSSGTRQDQEGAPGQCQRLRRQESESARANLQMGRLEQCRFMDHSIRPVLINRFIVVSCWLTGIVR